MIQEEMKNFINGIQESIDKNNFIGKFVERENLHISLSFLGEVEEGKTENIQNSLDEIVKNYEKFKVKIGSIKFIPREAYTRVLALEIDDQNNLLDKLSREIKQNIGGDVKPPHLTLCRVRMVKNKTKFLENVKSVNFDAKELEINKIDLVKSELRRSGPIYLIMHSALLKKV